MGLITSLLPPANATSTVTRFEDTGQGDPNEHTNWGTVEFNSAFVPNYRRVRSSGVQNDAAIIDMPPLAAGTYTFWWVGETSPDQGIMSVQVDDGAGGWTTLATLDQYASALSRPVRQTATALAITETGAARRLRLLMATKNALATAYFGVYFSLGIYRTGA